MNNLTNNLTTHLTMGKLIIDLHALRNNWRRLNKASGKAECAAVVKANGYGCGADMVVRALIKEKCKSFFVANVNEAIELRKINKKIKIFSFAGFNAKTKNYFLKYDIIAVLNSLDEIELCASLTNAKLKSLTNAKLKCAIHIDTGMNRLGINIDEWQELVANKKLLSKLDLQLLMTHYACADVAGHKKTKQQTKIFQRAIKLLPKKVPCSAANSAALLQGKYEFNLTRPGIALYGGQAIGNKKNNMRVVVSLFGKIIKIRECKKGEAIGYGASEVAKQKMKIAYVGVGYGDGYMRSNSNKGVEQRKLSAAARGYFKGRYIKGVGRVSMDMCAFDISKVKNCKVGDYIELLGEHVKLEEVAKGVGTIGYEVLTGLATRVARIYK